MKRPSKISRAQRLPLAAALGSILLAGSALLWRMDSLTKADALLESTRLSRLQHTEQLARQSASTDQVASGLVIYEKLKNIDVEQNTAQIQSTQIFPPEAEIRPFITKQKPDAESLWIEHTTQLRLVIPHENHLLKALADWRTASPGLHQLRSCQIERQGDALQADCQLSQLTLAEDQAQ